MENEEYIATAGSGQKLSIVRNGICIKEMVNFFFFRKNIKEKKILSK